MNHYSGDEPNKLPAAIRVASELMRRPPETAFALMERPRHEHLWLYFPKYIEDTITSTEDVELSSSLLAQDVVVTADILLHTIKLSEEDISYEQAVRIATHEETVRIITALALQNANDAKEMAYGARYHSSSVFKLSPDQESIIIRPGMQIPESNSKGCPAAQPIREGLAPPLFRNFVKWSGTIAAHSGYHSA